MRVIAGAAKGRRLKTVRGRAVRPTGDKVKGALFSILGSRVRLASAQLLDLFAGSGALGIEALSRGAQAVTFVEQATAAAEVLRENLSVCRFAAAATVLRMPATRALAHLSNSGVRFDGVFMDPPYGQNAAHLALVTIGAQQLLRPGGWAIVEHHIDDVLEPAYGGLHLTQTRRYGKTGVTLFLMEATMPVTTTTATPSISRAVYAGSFDPITKGHVDVVRRALNVFDELIVAVASNTSDPAKDHALFTADERVAMIRDTVAGPGSRVTADRFSGLLVDYCERVGARVIIRGLRAVSDFEYEFQMAMMNRHLKPHIETLFLTTGESHFYTSSRLVKEVASLGGDMRGLLPDVVHEQLLKKLQQKR